MPESSPFVRVNTQSPTFTLAGEDYRFLGTNFWYGLSLGSPGPEGDRPRLVRELDQLCALGVRNLRILAASEGPDGEPWRMNPALQPRPGQYNADQFAGLDFLLAEMGKRSMKAVVVLGNMWQWSGGFAAYVAWIEKQQAVPYPGHSNEPADWDRFAQFASRFYSSQAAQQLYFDHLQVVIERTNPITGQPYKQDPTIMAWQLANEPRGQLHSDAYVLWLTKTARRIKELDNNHLVSVGSEGITPWTKVLDNRFAQVHEISEIDYATFHVWVQNWNWYDPTRPESQIDQAISEHVQPYLDTHEQIARRLGKPLVLEEFGISRAGGSCDPGAETSVRDEYYRFIFDHVIRQLSAGSALRGVNFWAWSGEGRPTSPGADWQCGDPYTGDPPHEPQGWYGVYDQDESTHQVIRDSAKRIAKG